MDDNRPYYILLEAHYINWLANEVNEKLKEGYVLYGSPFSRKDEYCQAMILPSKES